ncbi:MAG: hypothetical protein P9M00_12120 [Candidatus Tritonobacter lacicola]|nr:hypothetical protein [Candidatus Tritonobacter lacicola]
MKTYLPQLILVVCLCTAYAPPPAHTQQDCYFNDTGDYLVLGNSKVELHFDKTYGKLLSLINRDTGTDFVDATHNTSSWFLRYHNNPDKWETSHDRSRTTVVRGWEKPLTEKPLTGREKWEAIPGSGYIELNMYHSFTLGTGECTVTQRVRVLDGSPFTRWRIIIDNPATDTDTDTGRTIVSVTYPHIRGLNVLEGDDYCITPHRRGERWENFNFERILPSGTVHIRGARYPLCGWQWVWYGNDVEGLYYAALDKDAVAKSFRYGYDDRQNGSLGGAGRANKDEEIALTQFPFLEPGGGYYNDGIWYSTVLEIGIKSGPGWYWGADRYREFIENPNTGWTRDYPDWAKEAHSFIWWTVDRFAEYDEELLNKWEENQNHNLMDQQWYEDGSSQYYWPRFVLKGSKGTREELEGAMQVCEQQQDHVIYFTNIFHADRDGAWFGANPLESVIKPDGSRAYVEWPYMQGKLFYQQSFHSEALRYTVINDHEEIKDAGVDGAWLDCVMVFAPEIFCYGSDHGHYSPAHAMGPGLTGFLKRLNDEVWRVPGEGTGRILGIEGISDFLIPYVDLWSMNHLSGYQGTAEGGGTERDYPEVARYLLPGVFGSLMKERTPGVPDKTEPWPQASFTFGCKLAGGPINPYVDHTKYYAAYDAAPDAFYHGSFKAGLGLTASGAVNLKAFSFVGSGGDTVVVTIWNRDSVQKNITVTLDLSAIGITGTVTGAVDLMGRDITWPLGGASFTSTVPADDVTAVKLTLYLGPTPTPTITPTATPSNTPTVTGTPTPSPAGPRKLALMKRENLNDSNLYYYNCPAVGSMDYYAAKGSNESALARDMWIIPAGNDSINAAAIELTGDTSDELLVLTKEGTGDVNLYIYNTLVEGDWTYWDANARNPDPLARDLWIIPSGNDAVGMAAIDVDGHGQEREIALLKKEGAGDVNLYLYNSPLPGDWTYWDADARNPSALARDMWIIPAGNDAVGIAALDVTEDGRKELAILKKEGAGDVNLYIYNCPLPGDRTYWDALSRNPTPLARDMWIIPGGNDAIALSAIDMDLDMTDELAILKLENGGDMNLYFYNAPRPGDWTYWDADARNPDQLARDLWIIPSGNDASAMTAVRIE